MSKVLKLKKRKEQDTKYEYKSSLSKKKDHKLMSYTKISHHIHSRTELDHMGRWELLTGRWSSDSGSHSDRGCVRCIDSDSFLLL